MGWRIDEVADEPIGDVDVGFAVFGGGVVLEDGADRYMQSGEFRELAGTFFVAVDIGKGYCFAAFQDGESGLVELGFAAGGEPGVSEPCPGSSKIVIIASLNGCNLRILSGNNYFQEIPLSLCQVSISKGYLLTQLPVGTFNVPTGFFIEVPKGRHKVGTF